MMYCWADKSLLQWVTMLPWRTLHMECDLASNDISKNVRVSHVVRYGEFLFSDAMLNATFILAKFWNIFHTDWEKWNIYILQERLNEVHKNNYDICRHSIYQNELELLLRRHKANLQRKRISEMFWLCGSTSATDLCHKTVNAWVYKTPVAKVPQVVLLFNAVTS